MLKIGDQAPEFSLPNSQGEDVSLSIFLATGPLILYFYPADFTPVCTAEACAFRDNYDGVAELGVQIVGVSPQSADSHARFTKQFNLPFPLLADANKQVIRRYGVDGPFGIGVRRVTYLIDQEKNIVKRAVADFSTSSHLNLLKETLAS